MDIIKGHIAHFPLATATPDADLSIMRDGALVIEGEDIIAMGHANDMVAAYPHAHIHDHSGKWLIPGLIDSHVHYPQTESIAYYGEQLLDWLKKATFPTEQKFADETHARAIAEVFVSQLFRHGTTTALVYSSVHKHACEAIFQAATRYNMALIAGKVCMDRHCPPALQDTAESAQQDSAALIERWHNKGRNLYALTPRFAPTSSAQQLKRLGELAQQYPDVFVQTHLSENKDEIDWVASLYPDADNYLDVYDRAGLVRHRSVFGHALHLSESEWQCLADRDATIAFCPSSNLFLGSGLFDLQRAKRAKVPVTLATDVGAGTGFSMLKTYADGYKVSQLQQAPLSPREGFYMATQSPAAAYNLAQDIGNLNPGSKADIVVLDPQCDELTRLRLGDMAEFDDCWFALSILGTERAVAETWVAGQAVYSRDN
ncbi:guanine deaminase [Alteromonas halophila]|uniref:Guanine deaminase n=1 Tax=Alteromonas halophila TaxID=516698 RepID=A0A918JHJ7_9ALTE|nr:guanine deaminase [Alteromonas halophila]GGW76269.1 guanine deaminase [Alteromonas halophila]